MKSKTADHALAILKAALNVVPYVGGPVASLIGDYVPTSRQRATEKAAKLLADKIAEIEDRIDTTAIDQECFADLFGQFETLAGKTNREKKTTRGS